MLSLNKVVSLIAIFLFVNSFVHSQEITQKGTGSVLKEALYKSIVGALATDVLLNQNEVLFDAEIKANPEKYILNYKISEKRDRDLDVLATVDIDSVKSLLNIKSENVFGKKMINAKVNIDGFFEKSEQKEFFQKLASREIRRRLFNESRDNPQIFFNFFFEKSEKLEFYKIKFSITLDSKEVNLFVKEINGLNFEKDVTDAFEEFMDRNKVSNEIITEEQKISIIIKGNFKKCIFIFKDKLSAKLKPKISSVSAKESTLTITSSKKPEDFLQTIQESIADCKLKANDLTYTNNTISFSANSK